jgi:uncharacterized protein YrrD
MHKLSELVGKSIVSAESGEQIGKVADMLLDKQSQRVLAIVIEGGLFSSEHVLPFADVQTLGKDAVVARSGTGVVGAKDWHQRAIEVTRTSGLKHKLVLTTSGRALGEIHDVLLDETGIVEGFEITGSRLGRLMGRHSLLTRADGITAGADAVIVSDESAAAIEASRK